MCYQGMCAEKLLVYGATVAADIEDASGFGWALGDIVYDWPALIAAKDKELERLEGIYKQLLASAGAELIAGRGRLTGPHEVSVGDRKLTAKTILIATGGWPQILMLPALLSMRSPQHRLLI